MASAPLERYEVSADDSISSRRSSLLAQEQLHSHSPSRDQPRQLDTPPPDAPIVSPSVVAGLQNDPGYRPGLRRKLTESPRRSFQSDFERPDLYRYSSKRRLRANGDDGDRDYYSHPDNYERNRPPRSYRNMDNGWDTRGGPGSRANFNSNRSDLERAQDQWIPNDEFYRSRNGSFDGNYYDRKQEKYSGSLNNEEKTVWEKFLDTDFKNLLIATLGEFVGTTMFLFFGFAGAQAANVGTRAEAAAPGFDGTPTFDITVFLYIAFSFGFSLLVNVWIFYRISGAQFNPAVTLALTLVGAVPVLRAVSFFFAQTLGAITASALVLVLFPGPLRVSNSLGSGTNVLQGVFIEALLTAELVFTILMLAKEKHRATFLAPLGIGFTLFISVLVGVNFTGASLNPARSFGPCVVTNTFESEHWIYWVGPTLGALIAAGFYKVLVLFEYEMANPGQDGDDRYDPTKNEARYREIISRRNA